MAKTKQTAAKSTGGKAPLATIAYRAARNPRGPPPDEEPATSVLLIGSNYEVRRATGEMTRIPVAQAGTRLGPEIIDWCAARPGRLLTTEIYARWRLNEWLPAADRSNSTGDDTDSSIDESEFCPMEVYLDVRGRYHANTTTNQKKFFPLVFCSLFAKEPATDRVRFLDQLDSWCMEHPTRKYMLAGLGAREQDVSELPVCLRTDHAIIYRSDATGCAPCAVANLIHRADAAQAVLMEKVQRQLHCRSLRWFAAWMSENTSWTLQRVVEDPVDPAQRIGFLLQLHRGLFLIVPVDQEKANGHVVGVDMFRRLVFDSLERCAMPLSPDSLQRALGPGRRLYGISELRQLFRKTAPRRK